MREFTYKLAFGKYRGKRIEYIFLCDWKYAKYLYFELSETKPAHKHMKYVINSQFTRTIIKHRFFYHTYNILNIMKIGFIYIINNDLNGGENISVVQNMQIFMQDGVNMFVMHTLVNIKTINYIIS